MTAPRSTAAVRSAKVAGMAYQHPRARGDETAPQVRMGWPVAPRLARAALSRPSLLLRLAREHEPVWRDGRRLHPSLQAMLAVGERMEERARELSIDARRGELRRLAKLASPEVRDVHVYDRAVPGPAGEVTLRCYRPHGLRDAAPGVLSLHGGGWVAGDLETHDASCRLLAVASRCVVVAVDYRRPPEARFPAALDDVVAAYRWLLEHSEELGVRPEAVGVTGDSAGGNLAAALCLEARRLELPQPAVQRLIYPAVELHFRTESCQTFAKGFGLTLDAMHWYRDQYVPDPVDWDDPRASPLLAPDLSGLAPALVVTAGFDPLRDEGFAYAGRLAEAGVAVEHRCIDDMAHAFYSTLVLPDALAVATELDAHLGRLLRQGEPLDATGG